MARKTIPASVQDARYWRGRAEKAEAEVARLRELLEPFANATTIHGKRISAELTKKLD